MGSGVGSLSSFLPIKPVGPPAFLWDEFCIHLEAKAAIHLARIFRELLSRDREDGRACPPS